MVIEAYYFDDHNTAVSREELDKLGVLQWNINADDYEEELSRICEERKYGHRSVVNISKETMPDLEDKLKMFFEEHLHEFEEIRFILDGSGYFDVRDKQDRWIRLHVKKNDLIILPAGMYHRFTLDEKRYAKAMRLFSLAQPEPVWTPLNRSEASTEATPARNDYVTRFVKL